MYNNKNLIPFMDVSPLYTLDEVINKAKGYLKYSRIKLKIPGYVSDDQCPNVAILLKDYKLDNYTTVSIALEPTGNILFLKDVSSSYLNELSPAIKGVYNYVSLTLSFDEIEENEALTKSITNSIMKLIDARLLMMAKRIHDLQNFNYQVQRYNVDHLRKIKTIQE